MAFLTMNELKAQKYTILKPLVPSFKWYIAKLSTRSWSKMTRTNVKSPKSLFRTIWGQGPRACHGFFPSQTPLASRATPPFFPARFASNVFSRSARTASKIFRGQTDIPSLIIDLRACTLPTSFRDKEFALLSTGKVPAFP